MALIVETGLRGTRDNFDEVLTANIGPAACSRAKAWKRRRAALLALGRPGGGIRHARPGPGASLRRRPAARWGKGQLANLADHADEKPSRRCRRGSALFPAALRHRRRRLGRAAQQGHAWREAVHGPRLSGLGKRQHRRAQVGAEAASARSTPRAATPCPKAARPPRPSVRGTTGPARFLGERGARGPVQGLRDVGHHHARLPHDRPMWASRATWPKASTWRVLVVEATVLGALSYQLKNIAAGRDLEAMDTAHFWLKAAATGRRRRHGRRPAQDLVPDQVDRRCDARADARWRASRSTPWRWSAATLRQLEAGENTNFGREAARFGKNVRPRRPAAVVHAAWASTG